MDKKMLIEKLKELKEQEYQKQETHCSNGEIPAFKHSYGKYWGFLESLELAQQLNEQPSEPCEVKYLGYVSNQGCTYQCDCGYYEVVDSDFDDKPFQPQMFRYTYCRNCGKKLKFIDKLPTID